MKRLFWMVMVVAAASCGSCDEDSGSNNTANNDSTNNATTDATNNGTGNATNNGTSNVTNNNTNPIMLGWYVELTEGDVALPEVEGTTMLQESRVSYNTLEGSDAAPGGLLVIELAGQDLREDEYEDPRLFEMTWEDPNYRCTGDDGFLVTVTGLDPGRGDFAGPVSCVNVGDSTDRFDGSVTGWFGLTD